jgi:hypothetical protein
VQFVNQHGKLSEPFYFIDHRPHEASQTWQVRRSEFDHLSSRQRTERHRHQPGNDAHDVASCGHQPSSRRASARLIVRSAASPLMANTENPWPR